MHIVHVGANYRIHTTNGVNRAVTLYARYQRLLGHEVTMVSFSSEVGKISEEATAEGIQLVRLPHPRVPILLSPEGRNIFRHDTLRGDIYHFHSSFIPMHNHAARLLPKPYVISPHGAYSPWSLQRSKLRKQTYRYLLDRVYLQGASAVHAVTEAERAQVTAYCGAKNVEVIPNPVEPVAIPTVHEKKSARDSLGIHPAEFVILFIGRLDVEHKGLDLLIEGSRMCRERGPAPHLRLVIAGPADRRFPIDQFLTRQDKDWVTVHPPVFGEQKRALYAAADLFASVSRWEGLPTAVLEAAAHGLPVLVSNASGLAEFVTRSNTGSSIPPSANAVAASLLEAIHKPCTDDRRHLIAHATREAFDPRVVARQLVNFYERVIPTRDRNPEELGLSATGIDS